MWVYHVTQEFIAKTLSNSFENKKILEHVYVATLHSNRFSRHGCKALMISWSNPMTSSKGIFCIRSYQYTIQSHSFCNDNQYRQTCIMSQMVQQAQRWLLIVIQLPAKFWTLSKSNWKMPNALQRIQCRCAEHQIVQSWQHGTPTFRIVKCILMKAVEL